jgi:hypothetical protein
MFCGVDPFLFHSVFQQPNLLLNTVVDENWPGAQKSGGREEWLSRVGE